MKLISLNVWGGKQYEPLMEFIKLHSLDTDIFCFQEVFDTPTNKTEEASFRLNLYKELCKILPDHKGYFHYTTKNYVAGAFQPDFTNYKLFWGLAIFIKRKYKVEKSGDFFVYRKRGQFNPGDLNTLPRNLEYVTFTENGKIFSIANLHGIWLSEGKNDAPSRISQSDQILEFFNKQKGEKILVGDFNLNMSTKSIKMLEKEMRNLIRDYKIKTTRNKLFPGHEKYADYTFVSKGLKVKNFEVPNIEVSDHLPMILEF